MTLITVSNALKKSAKNRKRYTEPNNGLTEEALRSALREIMGYKVNKELLYDIGVQAGIERDDDKLLDWAVDQIYSDELLDYLNDKLRFKKVCSIVEELDDENIDTGDFINTYEAELATCYPEHYFAEIMPNVYNERLVYVGYDAMDDMGYGNSILYNNRICTYISETGKVVFLDVYSHSSYISDNKTWAVYRKKISPKDIARRELTPFLDGIKDYLPDGFDDYWD